MVDTPCAVIGCELIDQGKRFSLKDPKDDDLSANSWMKLMHCIGSTSCGLDDFVKRSDQQPDKFKFAEHYSVQSQ